jgi:hypothetical protein
MCKTSSRGSQEIRIKDRWQTIDQENAIAPRKTKKSLNLML